MDLEADLHFSHYPSNPLDNVEEVLLANNWMFSRPSETEILVELTGKACTYRVFFLWQKGMSAIQLCCQFDMRIAPQNRARALDTIAVINENLWMGHFDLPKKCSRPSFRQTCLLRGSTEEASLEQIEDLVEISMAQCERYHPVLQLLSTETEANDNAHSSLALALMEPQGEG